MHDEWKKWHSGSTPSSTLVQKQTPVLPSMRNKPIESRSGKNLPVFPLQINQGGTSLSLFVLTILMFFCFCFPANAETLVIPIEGKIDHGMAGFVERSLSKHESASPVILRIDTFGGRVDAALDIVQSVSKDNRNTYALIKKKAWSAGAMISLACDHISMLKGASIGSATPVTGGGKKVSEKYVSALRAEFRSIAEKNNYPVSLAEAMVDKSIQIHKVRVDDSKIRYVRENEIKDLKSEGHTVKKELVYLDKGKLLNLTAEEARETGFTNQIHPDESDFFEAYGINSEKIIETQQTWSEHLVTFLQNSAVTTILMMIGMMAFYAELKAPGIGIFGLIAVSMFLLISFNQYLVGMAGMMEIVLVLAGLILVMIEIFVLPGLGWAGIPGAVCLGIGLLLSLLPGGIPTEYPKPWEVKRIKSAINQVGGGIVLGFIGILLLYKWLPSRKMLSPLTLSAAVGEQPGENEDTDDDKSSSNSMGKIGKAITELNPTGKIRLNGKTHDARADGPYIDKGTDVFVVDKEFSELIVQSEDQAK